MEKKYKTIIAEALKKHFEAKGLQYKVELADCYKANQHYTALRVGPVSGKIGVSFDVTPFEKMISDGKTLKEVVEEIGDIVARNISDAPISESEINSLGDYEIMKDKFVLSLIGVKGNEKFLEAIPHKIVGEDLALYARILVNEHEGRASVVVDNRIAGNRSANEVLNEAAVASSRNASVVIKTLTGMVRDLTSGIYEIEEEESIQESILVVTSKSGIDGAGAIFYDGVLERLSKMLGGSFYILPSSRHEVLAVKQDTEMGTAETLLETVCAVNATTVNAVDFLADSVYYYDAESKDFRRVATKAESLAEAV